MNNTPTIYIKANESGYTKEQFGERLFELLMIANKKEKKEHGYCTVIIHPISELQKKYNNSCVAIKGEKIIGSSSIYPTKMAPLDNISYQSGSLKIGECGSTVIDLPYQKGIIAYRLLEKTKKIYGSLYDVLISATINASQYRLRKKIGFEDAQFPKEYYNEGKLYFKQIMDEQGESFDKQAKFTISALDSNIKKYIIDLLANQ